MNDDDDDAENDDDDDDENNYGDVSAAVCGERTFTGRDTAVRTLSTSSRLDKFYYCGLLTTNVHCMYSFKIYVCCKWRWEGEV